MICISIAQESRRLALADMLNAGRQCDLLEVRLDRFERAPDLKELLAAKPKPVIFSCRRPRDGGLWEGSEDERLTLLRQCIIDRADYVEIELDVADKIRPFPPTRRVISYTNLRETPSDIAEIHAEAATKNADVVKLTTLARTPEEAWPLVQILAKATVPTVVVGLGLPGVMLTVLGKKIGAPWVYAALERGMEAHPDQPTISDLREIYHYDAIDRTTRLVGVTGFGKREKATVAALNAVFAANNLPARCLPLGVGNVRLFRKVIEAAKMAAVIIDDEHRSSVMEIATECDPWAERSDSADVLRQKQDKWQAFDTQGPAALAALENAVHARFPSGQPLKGRITLVVGANDLARRTAAALAERGAALIITGHDTDAVQKMAKDIGCRQIRFEALYTTMHDVLVVCENEAGGKARSTIHGGYLRPGMAVMDLTATIQPTRLLEEARQRGCSVVTPEELWLDQVALQARLLAGKDVPREQLRAAVPFLFEEA